MWINKKRRKEKNNTEGNSCPTKSLFPGKMLSVSTYIRYSLKRKKKKTWYFSGSPVAKALPSSVRDAGSIPGQGAKSHMPRGQ